MATNDKEAPVDAEVEEEEEETPEAELAEDTTDWKAETAKARRIASRLRTKLAKATEKKVEKTDPVEKKTGLDRLDRAVLRVEKITASDEVELVETIMKETGKDVEGVLASKYFQGELAALRETRATKDATPSGMKRSGQSPKSDVDYWLAKGELPPNGDPLRSKVVQARLDREKNKSTFTDNPVA